MEVFYVGCFNPINIVSQVALAAATGGTSMLVEAAIQAVVSAVVQQVIQQVGQQLGLPPEVINMAQQAFSAASGNAGGAAEGLGGFAQQGVSGFTQNFAQQALGGFAGGGLQAALSNFNQVGNLSPSEMGQVNRAVDHANEHLTNQIVNAIRTQSNSSTAGNQIADLLIAQTVDAAKVALQRDHNNSHQVGGSGGKSAAVGTAAAGGNTGVAGGAATDAAPAADGASVIGNLGLSGGGFLVALATAIGQTLDKKSDDMMKLAKAANDEGNKKIDTKDANAVTSRQSNMQTYSSVLQAVGQEISTLSNALSNSLKSLGEAQQTLARKG